MAFVLIIVGLVLLASAVQGTTTTLFGLVKNDFVGTNNFIYWFSAILIIGAVGYIPKARPISIALLGLVLVVLFIKNDNGSTAGGGFFAEFTSALNTTTTAAPSTAVSTTTATTATSPLAAASSSLQSTINAITGGSTAIN